MFASLNNVFICAQPPTQSICPFPLLLSHANTRINLLNNQRSNNQQQNNLNLSAILKSLTPSPLDWSELINARKPNLKTRKSRHRPNFVNQIAQNIIKDCRIKLLNQPRHGTLVITRLTATSLEG